MARMPSPSSSKWLQTNVERPELSLDSVELPDVSPNAPIYELLIRASGDDSHARNYVNVLGHEAGPGVRSPQVPSICFVLSRFWVDRRL